MLQKEKVAPHGWRRPLGYYALQRFPSIYMTRLLLPTHITPNQITVVGFFIGLAGCAFVLQWAWHLKLIGIGLLYLNVLLDKVDGEIARYKKIYSLRGIYLDYTNHLIMPPLFLLAFTFGLLPFSPIEPTILLIAGIAAGFAMMLLRVQQNIAEIIFIKKYIPHRDIFSFAHLNDHIGQLKKERPRAGHVLWLFHHVQEHALQLWAFALFIVLERYFLLDFIFHPLLSWALLLLGSILPLIVIENVAKGWIAIEGRIADIKKRIDERSPADTTPDYRSASGLRDQ